MYLDEVLTSVPHAAHAKYYAEIVREKAVQRSLIYACTDVLTECYDSSRPVQEVLDTAEQKIFAISESQDGGEKIAIDQILQMAWDRIEERANSDGDATGLPTGIPRPGPEDQRVPAGGTDHPRRPPVDGEDGVGL